MDEENNEGRAEIYELGYHIVSSVAESDLPQEVNAIKSFIEEKGGIIISDEFPKIKPLFYTMYKAVNGAKKHYNSAYFGWIKFEIGTDSIASIKERVMNNSNILRYLIVKTVRENTIYGPKIAQMSKMQGGAEREGRKEKQVVEDKPKMSAEEIDKTIDEMVKE
ncbi:MAG: hypothetical protein A3G52_04260 [Candidatus Taylorbacteria bacterium RIFCSPLOWO2_12_FULL_43_20]|uniref:Small ribosomal subunit protein bS6 n=1 Tax=Candidatus Taylorbacteria bacterium RIFCSPLOWO2_12_FULL_43_20 TaxID=1802332 RepID=A0A1G2P046_9BACT|nr:MAG: hypothetical protein A2825_00530 [Candidatus Taylorbacteria bacterium RIFCSPHIGHO2_01_FULL_43_120]OHA23825.1 MAG: hypothetical protein A3B98_00080 [Candidatus Taylorbacteria bacterium RIFCSPHIGHO2_02_FULL_43_55]OHA38674.1 MAG: hypothetical protein A3H58_03530 [Candidatus Taylorbacteria bacterium RIFCSPLOWO2_02_FULL_43_22b]OHA41653.1 MAG: hypothetical protein A3G52_04260 [Candidatus Taylorbacteria bacterium RIFCSPLOWO2_12_FULL_43_20]